MDNLTEKQRSHIMSSIRGKDTRPEMMVRRICHRLGYRFRLHRRDLPGTPDLVFPRHKKVILVHGCFWHQHSKCGSDRRPKGNREFWNAKLDRNVQRDARNIRQLRKFGWGVMIVWECQLKDINRTARRIIHFLG